MDIHRRVNAEEEKEISKESVFDIFKTPVRSTGKGKIGSSPGPLSHRSRRTPKRKCAEDRIRTPSGQLLTPNVSAIKDLIEAKTNSQPFKIAKVDDSKFSFGRRRSTGTINFPLSAIDCESVQQSSITMTKPRSVNNTADDGTPSEVSNMMDTRTFDEASVDEDHRGDAASGSEVGIISAINSKIVMAEEHMKSGQSSTNPAVVDARSVVMMLESLKTEMTEKMQELTLCESEEGVKKLHDRVQELERQLNISHAKERMMIETMARMSDLITELQKKGEMQDINQAKRMAILSGFEGSDKKGICKKQVRDFIQEEIGISVYVEDLFYLGDAGDMVITLASVEQKRLLFQRKSAIKNLENSKGRRFFFRDYQLPKQNELYKKYIEIDKWMKQEDEIDQKEVRKVGNSIYVGEEKYVRRISPPDPAKTLQLPLHELNRVIGLQVHAGPKLEHKNNIFTAYSIDANQYSQVEDAYLKL